MILSNVLSADARSSGGDGMPEPTRGTYLRHWAATPASVTGSSTPTVTPPVRLIVALLVVLVIWPEAPEAPEVGLVDIGLPGMGGLEGLPLMRERYPGDAHPLRR